MATIETTRSPPLFHVRINRPEARNAVDRPTAEAPVPAQEALQFGLVNRLVPAAELAAVAGESLKGATRFSTGQGRHAAAVAPDAGSQT